MTFWQTSPSEFALFLTQPVFISFVFSSFSFNGKSSSSLLSPYVCRSDVNKKSRFFHNLDLFGKESLIGGIFGSEMNVEIFYLWGNCLFYLYCVVICCDGVEKCLSLTVKLIPMSGFFFLCLFCMVAFSANHSSRRRRWGKYVSFVVLFQIFLFYFCLLLFFLIHHCHCGCRM